METSCCFDFSSKLSLTRGQRYSSFAILQVKTNTNLIPEIAENTRLIPEIAENTRLIPEIAEKQGVIIDEIRGLHREMTFDAGWRARMESDIQAIKAKIGIR